MIEVKKILGIHNYCNRWCERCDFTTRCTVALRETEFKKNTHNSSNEDIWSTVHTQLEEAFDLLKDILEKIENPSPFEPSDKSSIVKPPSSRVKSTDSFPQENQLCDKINLNSKAYGLEASQWFSENAVFLEEKELELNQLLEIGARHIIQEANQIKEAILIARWNMFFIGAKLNRAVSGLKKISEEEDLIQNDINGSAKVALIAIEDSLFAWNIICNKIPELSDELLDMLVKLVRLKKDCQMVFPNALQFTRPGFDQ